VERCICCDKKVDLKKDHAYMIKDKCKHYSCKECNSSGVFKEAINKLWESEIANLDSV
jgi:hypothetical protein